MKKETAWTIIMFVVVVLCIMSVVFLISILK